MNQRHKVSTSGGARLPLLVAGVAALLLLAALWAGQLEPPPPVATPLPPVAQKPTIAPTATPTSDTQVVYVLSSSPTGTYAPHVDAYGLESRQLLARYGRGDFFVLSHDGRTLVIFDQPSRSLRAIDTATGQQRWLLPDLAFPREGSGPPLVLADDDSAGVVLLGSVDQFTRGQITATTALAFDLRTGAILHEYTLPVLPVISQLSLNHAAGQLRVATERPSLLTLDLISGVFRIDEDPTWRVLALAPAVERVFALTTNSELAILDDQLTVVQMWPLGFEVLDGGFPRMAVDPSATRLLLRLARRDTAQVTLRQPSGWRMVEGQPELLLCDPATGQLEPLETPSAANGFFSLMVLDPTEALLYNGATVVALPMPGHPASLLAAHNLRDVSWLQLGPRTDTGARSLVEPTPLPSRTLDRTPALLTSLLLEPAQPLGWVWRSDRADRPVEAYQTDGTFSVIASDVEAWLARPDQPPLLVQQPAAGPALLYDPLDQSRRSLGFVITPVAGRNNLPALLAPDQDQLLLQAEDYLIDDVQRDEGLVLVDLAAGTAQTIGLPESVPASDFRLLGWGADGIYAARNHPNTFVMVTTTIWRLDPANPTRWQAIWDAPQGALIDFDAASQSMLYQLVPTDPAQGKLYLRDLRSGADTLLYSGVVLDNFTLAPGGEVAVYAVPKSLTSSRSSLFRYTRAIAETIIIPVNSARITGAPCISFLWSSDATRLQCAAFTPYPPGANELHYQWFDIPVGASIASVSIIGAPPLDLWLLSHSFYPVITSNGPQQALQLVDRSSSTVLATIVLDSQWSAPASLIYSQWSAPVTLIYVP